MMFFILFSHVYSLEEMTAVATEIKSLLKGEGEGREKSDQIYPSH